MALTLDGTNGIVSSGSITTQSATGIVFSDSSNLPAASSPYVLKNRIINGAMVIDQRNAGASVTITDTGANTYTLDRWFAYGQVASKFRVQQDAGAVTPPVGFNDYLGVTSLSAYTVGSSETFVIGQQVEGFNVADLAWGTASAKTVTLSFQVYSSLTGTFGGALQNSAQNRSYPFSYTVSSANTWTTVSVTIAGDTSGTWLTTNGVGIRIFFSLGVGATNSGTAGSWAGATYWSATGATSVVGTNGATFYITGVQLEQNTSATPFERRLYNQELANCMRYFQRIINGAEYQYEMASTLQCFSTTQSVGPITYIQPMRTNPTGSSSSASYFWVKTNGGGNTVVTTVALSDLSPRHAIVVTTVASGLAAGNATVFLSNSTLATLDMSAEL
jgi:hypothetical protein